MSLTARQQMLVEAVKTHALVNYETGGWDIVVETYEDSELAELIGRARTEKGAIAKVAEAVGAQAEYRAEIQALGDNYDYKQDAASDGASAVPASSFKDEPFERPTIDLATAPSVDEVRSRSPYSLPEATTTGVVCGSCSKDERTRIGDRKAQVRHASAALVRLCYDRKDEMETEGAAEYEAERRTERWFEERGGGDHEEQLASCYSTGPLGY